MTAEINARLYDEDSVFNRLFAEGKPKVGPSKGERLRTMFADVQTSAETVKVSDFLPSY